MPDIRQLSPSVVNKIAAGEVIERPASVVKELMENAVDAGAGRIDVAIEQGGAELIRVVDDGCGISAEQLPLAVAAHATSKIREADDLFRVGSLGFRGEALASIAEVSRMVLRSRPKDAEAGAELTVSGGELGPVTPCGAPVGTLIEVHNLFFNTPVRRKFLRATQTEMGHASEAFTRLALAYPRRHFTLRHQDKPVYDLPPTDDWLARIAAVCGEELAGTLIWVESRDGDVRLSGYVANPSQSRGNQRMQYLFLNGRAIRDRSLQHALGEAYRGLLLTGRYPVALLQIEMPPEAVDVNVHPTKLEVRFQDGGRLYSQLLGTLRTRFLTTDLTAKLRPTAAASTQGAAAAARSAKAPGAEEEGPFDAATSASVEGHDAARAAQMREELVRWAKGELAAVEAAVGLPGMAAGGANAAAGSDEQAAAPPIGWTAQIPPPHAVGRPVTAPLELVTVDRSQFGLPQSSPQSSPQGFSPQSPQRFPQQSPPQQPFGLERFGSDRSLPPAPMRQPAPAMQVHDRYLIAETDEGMVVIDQHALHERVLYEQLRQSALAGALETQRLLVPEPVDLSPAESAAAMADRELLARLGVQVEPFGGGTLLVTSYPAMLTRLRPAEVLRFLVERLLEGGKAPDRRDLLDELLHMIACKAAIKAGDRLTPEEIAALVEQRHLAQDSHHCPHGRPTALVFTRDELDRQFKRT